MKPTFGTRTLWVAVALVVTFGAASVGTYWPDGSTSRSLAVDDLKQALAALDARELDSAARLVSYRDGLSRADAHLRQALRSNPADTSSIERLAMVRWESSVLAGTPDTDSIFSLVRIAAERAPRVPELHANLGTLLYKMGIPAESARFMKRAVELSPKITTRVVASMQDAGMEPAAIVAILPRTVEVIVLLYKGLAESGHLSEWLRSAEELLSRHPSDLLRPYTEACLTANETDRLFAQLERLGVLPESRDEAERQLSLGRAHLSVREFGPAVSASARARTIAPGDSGVLDIAGQIAFGAGDWAAAAASFRDALGAIAREGSSGIARARLYRQHGQALERLGRVNDAFNDYRRAIEITPGDPWLQERLSVGLSVPLTEGRR